MRTLTTSALLITSALFLAACSTTPTSDNAAPAANTASTKDMSSKPAETKAVTTTAAATTPAPAAITRPLQRSVFFDYDRFDIKSEFAPLIEGHAKYLVANPNRKVTIEGNADERGGSEYNLALGQKRAEAERKALELLGVSPSQLEAISFGKEKPRSRGHDEASWADNRRADIVYGSK